MVVVTASGSLQHSEPIFEFGGRQCTCTAVTSLCYHFTHSPASMWQTKDIDLIMQEGETVFSKLIQNSSQFYLIPSDIKSLDLLGLSLDIVCEDSSSGTLDIDCSENCQMALCDALKDVDSCVFTFGSLSLSYAVSIIKDGDTYFCFDAHKKSLDGLLSADGFATLTQCDTFTDLLFFIKRLSSTVSIVDCFFEVVRLRVVPKNILQHCGNNSLSDHCYHECCETPRDDDTRSEPRKTNHERFDEHPCQNYTLRNFHIEPIYTVNERVCWGKYPASLLNEWQNGSSVSQIQATTDNNNAHHIFASETPILDDSLLISPHRKLAGSYGKAPSVLQKEIKKKNTWENISDQTLDFKHITLRKIKDGCGEICRRKCKRNFSFQDRQTIFLSYWTMGSVSRQREYLAQCVNDVPKKVAKIGWGSRRSRSLQWSFSVGTKRHEVCKRFFLDTLDISDSTVYTALSKRNEQLFKL